MDRGARTTADCLATVRRWLGDEDLLVEKEDRRPPMIIVPWSTWRRVCKALGRTASDSKP